MKKISLLEDVAYLSQFDGSIRPEWEGRACTFVCLEMGMRKVAPDLEIPKADQMFEESEILQQDMLRKRRITPEAIEKGRLHHTVTLIAHNHGVMAYPEEFRSKKVDLKTGEFSASGFEDRMLQAGLLKICKSLEEDNPVMVSVPRNLASENKNDLHMILLVGATRTGKKIENFCYHDPDSKYSERPKKFMYIGGDKFAEIWNRTAIFIEALPK